MIELGLQRISRSLCNTPTPWRAIHVAGTNGKGSVCAYISEMLHVYNRSRYREQVGKAPLRFGRFTSPHLVDRWDCISLNNGNRMEPVTSDVFNEVEKIVLDRNREKDIRATEFELLTATAFEIFTRSNLDVAVVEVGLGGRLDATNIIGQPMVDENGSPTEERRPLPLVTVITKIGLDHQGLLGNTIEEIAKEKAGILKPPTFNVLDSSNEPEVKDVLQKIDTPSLYSFRCDLTFRQSLASHKWQLHAKQNATVASLATQVALQSLDRLYPADRVKTRSSQDGAPDTFERKKFESNLASLSQVTGQVWRSDRGRDNASPANRNETNVLFQELQHDMAEAVAQLVFPGRQEWIDIRALTGRREHVLLDGAHNPQSAAVLNQKVAELRGIDTEEGITEPLNPITWVVAMTKGKQVEDFFQTLLKKGDNVVAVEFGPVDGMPWIEATPAGELIGSVREVMPDLGATHDCGKDLLAALKLASEITAKTPGQKLVIAGSLYLVGDTHRLLRQHKPSEKFSRGRSASSKKLPRPQRP